MFKLRPEPHGLGLTQVHYKWSANEMEILQFHCINVDLTKISKSWESFWNDANLLHLKI